MRRAGAFARNHRGPERRQRRALLAEGGTLVRLLQTTQDLTADAHRRFFGLEPGDVEQMLGVEIAIRRPQAIAAARNEADAAPFAIADFEDVIEQLACGHVSLRSHGPAVL